MAALPHEIHVISTSRGAERVCASMFGPAGWFGRLREDCELPPVSASFESGYRFTSELDM